MVAELIYAFRVMRLPLLDASGAPLGKIDDIVVVPGRTTEPPRVLGFVASSHAGSFLSTLRALPRWTTTCSPQVVGH